VHGIRVSTSASVKLHQGFEFDLVLRDCGAPIEELQLEPGDALATFRRRFLCHGCLNENLLLVRRYGNPQQIFGRLQQCLFLQVRINQVEGIQSPQEKFARPQWP
jgi:hypothetical protein